MSLTDRPVSETLTLRSTDALLDEWPLPRMLSSAVVGACVPLKQSGYAGLC